MLTSGMKNRLLIMVSLGIAVALNVYLRSYPVDFPQLKSHAKKIVENIIQRGTVEEVSKKFPQFYPLAKEEIKKSRISEYKKANKKTIDDRVDEFYKKLKDRYQDDKGQTYIMELDCWHWTRYVKNILELGHPGDKAVGRDQWDMYMLAPNGWKIFWDDFLYYLSAFLYRAFSLFHKVPLWTFLFYLPLFYIAICICVVYTVSFRYGKYIGAFITSLFIGLTPMFIPRSCAGWFDKDILCMTFPIAIFGAYIMSLAAHSFKKRLLWVFITSFLVGLFAFTWVYWWFIFAMIIMYEVAYLAYRWGYKVYFRKIKPGVIREQAVLLGALVVFSLLWIIVLAGVEPLTELYTQVSLSIRFNKPLMSSIWPNVFSTVGEMRKADFAEMARSIGGPHGVALCVTALICMIALLGRSIFERRFGRAGRASIAIIIIWFISMVFAATRGVRFSMFISPPLGLAAGWFAGDIYYTIRKKHRKLALAAGALMLVIFTVVTFRNGKSAAESCFPLMEDGWYKVLNLMKEKTAKDAIVNSWWDFGDWFKVVADRRVIFDGQSQGTPQAYWMAKALLTHDEKKCEAILRMLNNGGNEAFNIIDKKLNNPLLSALLLEGTMGQPEAKVRESLSKFLPELETSKVLRILFGRPADACFVVDNSMPMKIGAISYLGNWDFAKVYMAQNFDKEEKGKIIEYLKGFGKNEQELETYYQEVFLISTKNLDEWLSRRLQFYSGVMTGMEKGGYVMFENGFTFNPKDGTLRSKTGQVPLSLFIGDDNGVTERRYKRPNIVCSLLVYKTGSGYKMVMLDRDLGKSMFVRLYYLRGKGLKFFVPFIDADEGDNYIRVFGMAW